MPTQGHLQSLESPVAAALRLIDAGTPEDAGRFLATLAPAETNRALAALEAEPVVKEAWPAILAGLGTVVHGMIALGGGES